jgi:hypothetical protein
MTPEEAVSKINATFTVHEERGIATGWTDQNDKVMGMGARDMDTAPNGEPYEVVTSYGLGARLPKDALVMFQSESLAVRWWFDEVEDWASSLRSGREYWKRLNLYWRDKPTFHTTTYLAMDQGGLFRTSSPLAASHQIDLGFVWSRLLISTIGPNGEET